MTIPAEPSSFISKQLTRVFAQQRLCNAATSEAACKGLQQQQQQQQQQQNLGCYWNGQRCDAKERSDWSWFSRCVLWSVLALYGKQRLFTTVICLLKREVV
jgi:hypothetical protein